MLCLFSLQLLKWQRDLSELAKKAEHEPPGQPASKEEAGMTETKGTPSVFMDPLRYAPLNLNMSSSSRAVSVIEGLVHEYETDDTEDGLLCAGIDCT